MKWKYFAILLLALSTPAAADDVTEYALGCFAVTHVLIVETDGFFEDSEMATDWTLWKQFANQDMNRANRYITAIFADLKNDPTGGKREVLDDTYAMCHKMANDVRGELE